MVLGCLAVPQSDAILNILFYAGFESIIARRSFFGGIYIWLYSISGDRETAFLAMSGFFCNFK